jgi:hypothetical protein
VEAPDNRSVHVSVPPRTEFLSLLRTVAGGVASRMELSLDAIDDLCLAVDETVAFLLLTDRNAVRVELRFDSDDAELRATISIDSSIELWPPPGYEATLPWQVISGLTDGASITRSEQGTPTIAFIKRTLDPRST